MSRRFLRIGPAFVLVLIGLVWLKPGLSGQAPGLPSTRNGDWPHYTADMRGTKYSPLDQINASNFSKLEVAWRFKTDNLGPRPEYKLEGTPLAINGVLYTTGGTRRSVVALDGRTGELIWAHSLREGKRAAVSPRQLSGRGVSYWTDGKGDERILYVTTGYRLVALNAKTGAMIPSFGKNGVVDLKVGAVYGKRRADRSRDRRDRPPLDADRRQGRRHHRLVVPRRRDGRRRTTTPRAWCARSTCGPASCCGRSTPSRGPASSATTPGRTSRGRSTATPACGRRSPSTRSSASSTCRSRRRPRTSTAAIVPATTCSPRASSASI